MFSPSGTSASALTIQATDMPMNRVEAQNDSWRLNEFGPDEPTAGWLGGDLPDNIIDFAGSSTPKSLPYYTGNDQASASNQVGD